MLDFLMGALLWDCNAFAVYVTSEPWTLVTFSFFMLSCYLALLIWLLFWACIWLAALVLSTYEKISGKIILE